MKKANFLMLNCAALCLVGCMAPQGNQAPVKEGTFPISHPHEVFPDTKSPELSAAREVIQRQEQLIKAMEKKLREQEAQIAGMTTGRIH
jgi:uncharacterized protein YjcR